MNMTFKAKKFKEWTLTDNAIIIGKKSIPLDSITEMKHTPLKEGYVNGVIYVKYGPRIRDDVMLVYPMSQNESGIDAANYLASIADENKKQNKHAPIDPSIEAKKEKKKLNIVLVVSAIVLLLIYFVGVTFFGWNDNANKTSQSENPDKNGFIGSDGEYHPYVPEFGDGVNDWMEENW